jgi:uncharacterized membrane protein
MRGIAEFTKTILIGGVLVILPIYLSILLLAKTLSGVLTLLKPVTAQIPASMEFRQVIAILIVILGCFLAGLLVLTGPGLRAKNAIERHLLERIPGYAMIRGLTSRVAGRQEDEMFAVALVEIEEALIPAFIVEEHDDGCFTVFVPSVPTPAVGAIYILPKARVHRVDVPFAKAAMVITRWGTGARYLRAAMTEPSILERNMRGAEAEPVA